jgi:HAD superfamily 5'-nucleotidase-like hydrolase
MEGNFIHDLEIELKAKGLIEGSINSNLLNNVDVIGFDIDHTLSIYNHETMADLMYNSFIMYLVEHRGYPKELMIYHEDYKHSKFSIEQAYSLSTSEVIIDSKYGNVVRIDEEMKVFEGYHGTNKLTEDELIELYGNDRLFPDFDYEARHGANYLYVASFFEFHAIPIYLFCVQMKDEGMILHSYADIKKDLTDSFEFNFCLHEGEILKKIETSGYFFPEICKNPKKYLHPYSGKELLKYLRSKHKRIFICSNSYYEYADMILKNSFGEDYLDYVDIVFYFSKKPSFFKSSENFGYILDLSKPNHKGLNVSDMCIKHNDEIYNSLKVNKILIEGNYKLVDEFYQRELCKEEISHLFIGDSFNSDCIHSSRIKNWDSIAVYEMIEKGRVGSFPVGFGKSWTENKRDYFCKIIRDHTLFAISNVETLMNLD